MQLVATLSRLDFEAAFAKLTPLEIDFHGAGEAERKLVLHRPTAVGLVAGKGVAISTSAQLTWGVLGIAVPVAIESVRLWLSPAIIEQKGAPAMAFTLSIEELDLKVLPSFLDARVLDAVNLALASDDARVVWSFLDTLSFEFALPKQMTPGRAGLRALSGNLDVRDDAIAFSVRFESTVPRNGQSPAG